MENFSFTDLALLTIIEEAERVLFNAGGAVTCNWLWGTREQQRMREHPQTWRFDTAEERDRALEPYRLYAAWLREAAKFPGVRRMLARSQGSGENSPRTTVRLVEVVKEFPSPKDLERLLWATRRRADTLVREINGHEAAASWGAVMNGLLLDIQPNKAGTIAAVMFLDSLGNPRTYEESMQWLNDFRAMVPWTINGNPALRARETHSASAPEMTIYRVRIPRGKARRYEEAWWVQDGDRECLIVPQSEPETAARQKWAAEDELKEFDISTLFDDIG